MIRMHLSAAAHALHARHDGADVEFTGVSTDTRTLTPGALFTALVGPHFDGHDFIEQAVARGAAAALVSRATRGKLPSLTVPDTRLALGRLAHTWRRRFDFPLVAITGSNGKTTVKEMTAAILGRAGAVLVTQGNLNNDIGVPLTLFRLDAAQRYAVIEMGANHLGEISYLTGLARPTVALITNAGPAHLEGFGSLDGVARGKGEIYAGLDEHGVGVVNHDDAYASLWRKLIGARRCVSFGLTPGADVTATWRATDTGSDVQLRTPRGSVDIALPLPGRHNVMNALAAAAASLAAGATLEHVQQGLESMHGVAGRLQIKTGYRGARVIDDTYNANPASLAAAVQVLSGYAPHAWLVLGDMGELGADGAALHEQAGAQARAAHIERLFSVGILSAHAARAFGPAARHFATQDELSAALRAALDAAAPEKITLLIKGSRAARMERVVAALTDHAVEEH
ncbi:MAG: UDP-N-acetylmuramoyl-tripeptide--D-alanyl-D-alanine ligase [Pseudomonadota bacterium]